MPATIFIVYNANSGLMQGALDSFHKAFSPETYPCKLCALTHGYLNMKNAWKLFVHRAEEHGYQLKALHKDELSKWPFKFDDLPGIYLLRHGNLDKLIGRAELEKMGNLEELIFQLENDLAIFSISGSSMSASGIR